jgi:FixJ family two-component response regulator
VPNTRPIVAIVDDDNAVGNAIEVLIRLIGLVAQAFSSGEEFSCSPELSRTGCLVVDFDMPKMTGLDLHNNLSRLGKDIPTVLITAYPSDDIRARALEAGVICYLPKPFDESDLLNCIQTPLDRAKGDRVIPRCSSCFPKVRERLRGSLGPTFRAHNCGVCRPTVRMPGRGDPTFG